MQVAIAGGHGKIALRLTRLLRERDEEVRSLIRNPDHADEVREAGASPVICDLEGASDEQVSEAVGAVGAVVFAAGAGPGSGPERKETVDYGGAVKLIAAAKANGVGRYLMLSSLGADPSAEGDGFGVYLRAKGRADAALQGSGLDYTIVRPTSLTDDPGTSRVRVGDGVGVGSISRDDVAAVLAEALHDQASIGKVFELTSGKTPLEEAIASL